jgi:hypothetical protein
MAHLITNRPREAVELLAPLAATAKNAQIWSDLAAARYALALQSDDPAHLAGALAAADAALREQPTLPEALFNRALVLDRLGLKSQARAAWEQYLGIDRSSDWAKEARRHRDDLAPETEFRHELARDYERLTRDSAAARALTARFPQDARVWGESEILARWAQAHQAGENADADAHLRVAHAFGETLARRSGDAMLRAVVQSIERADPSHRILLASAHLKFREAQRVFKKNRPADAETLFLAAAKDFERAESPATLLARYFAANTAFEGVVERSSRIPCASCAGLVAARSHRCGAGELGRRHSLAERQHRDLRAAGREELRNLGPRNPG